MIKMTNLKILFLHGLESKPGGTKPTALSLEGHTVLNPSLPKDSFDESVAIAQKLVDSEVPDVIVGSSRGGAVAMAVNAGGARKVLVAPAWKKYGVEGKVDSGTIILHSESDDVVSFADTQEVWIFGTFKNASYIHSCLIIRTINVLYSVFIDVSIRGTIF